MPSKFVSWLQSRLTAHGFPCGAIDGDFGANTLAALKGFQSSRGLKMSGVADKGTVTALRASSSIVSPVVAKAIGDRDALPAGLPSSRPTIWPLQKDVPAYFGAVGKRQKTIEVAYDLALSWAPGTRVRRITVHELVADAVGRVMQEISETYSMRERERLGLNLFGGALNVRKMRGGSSYSMHSWGIALDFDPLRNALHTKAPQARLSHEDAKPFRDAWRREGALSLGEARNYDWMHFQFARL